MLGIDSFWQEERDVPPGSGFDLFGIEHILVIIIITLFIATTVIWFKKCKAGERLILIRVIAVTLPVLEVWKIIMLIASDRMDIGHLPIHLCSMSIYIYPVVTFLPEGRVRKTLTEISVITLLPAAISAIVFPDWTMYPILNFYCLHAFVWHSLQVVFPILCIMNRWCIPRIKNLWKNTVFLVICGSLVGLFDWKMSCNYWFLKSPVDGTPLEWLYDTFGSKWYIVSLLGIATIVNIIMYGICNGACHRYESVTNETKL